MRIALITCRRLPEPDPDQALLVAALQAAGAGAELVPWDDPAAPLRGFDLLVLRSTWNYHEAPAAFGRWLDRAAATARVVNPPPAVRWNLHKGYLRDLAAAGVRIPPTEFLPTGADPVEFAALLDARGWQDVVVKPAISAASAHTARFTRADAAAGQAFLDRHRPLRDMMVQQYQRSVETTGEHSLVWIAGEVTHGVRKAVRLAGQHEAVSTATAPDAEERAVAARAIAAAPPGLVYARADLMRDDAGGILLSELELIEPSLYLLQSPRALARFVRALLTG